MTEFIDIPDNGKCTHNFQCKSSACGLPAAGAAQHVCCESEAVDTYAANDYCTNMPSGTPCWSDAMCAGGTCSGNTDGLTKGTCSGNLPPNAPCVHNNQCKGGACGLPAAGASQHVCCTAGIDTYAGNDYCKGMAAGTACWSDAMCASGTCSGNNSGLTKGTCIDKAPVGAPCVHNDQCQLGACGYPTAGASSHVCCGGGLDTYAGNDYCKGMPAGAPCWSDAMCGTGTCHGNMSGLKKGHC